LTGRPWGPRIGWALVLLLFVVFVWGLQRRAGLERTGSEVIRMLFVPSVEQGTLVERGDDFARFMREDAGLSLRIEVPTSYAAVIQALGAGQADLAWMPAFAYVIANARYGAEARLQVVRTSELYVVVVARSGEGEPAALAELAGRAVVVPRDLGSGLRARVVAALDEAAPGWTELPAADDKEAVRRLLDERLEVAAAVSRFIETGPFDLVGDGRKELEYERPGTMAATRLIFRTEEPAPEDVTYYHGCILARTDGPRRIEDLNGARFAFSDETSTSGHIFPRMLLDSHRVTLGRVYYAGGHPNAVQAVWDGKAEGGAVFFSPANATQREEGLVVGDGRYLILRRMEDAEARRRFLEEVRVVKITDPIPNDLLAMRAGFPEEIFERFKASFDRLLQTELGGEIFFDVLSAKGAVPTDDSAYDGFRQALISAGVDAEGLLEAAERRLEERRAKAAEAGS
jgi:ABC-type phosphate/phosphonate transport system substrate-binding protein